DHHHPCPCFSRGPRRLRAALVGASAERRGARGRCMSVLAVEGLQKSFGGVQAVAGVSFAIAAGELLALIGPNGAGKTTCFNMVGGQLKPDAGRVRFAT